MSPEIATPCFVRKRVVSRADIEALAKAGLIDSRAVRRRAEEALAHYVGDVDAVRSSIDIGCRLIDTARPRKRR